MTTVSKTPVALLDVQSAVVVMGLAHSVGLQPLGSA